MAHLSRYIKYYPEKMQNGNKSQQTRTPIKQSTYVWLQCFYVLIFLANSHKSAIIFEESKAFNLIIL